jgi:deazaflavin-dependent oxidoreductase (nitroreductase family)
MVITHTGRVSGKRYRTPVNFTVVNGEVYCTAGFGKIADWYRNIMANPQVEIWLPQGWWSGRAVDISGAANHLELMRHVILASGFAGPMFGVNVETLDDESLAKITESYRLIHIEREKACTGPGGPGELAWIWQVATFVLLPLVFWRRKRK